MIREEQGRWILRTRDGSRVLGRHPSREAAASQERAILLAQKRRDHTKVAISWTPILRLLGRLGWRPAARAAGEAAAGVAAHVPPPAARYVTDVMAHTRPVLGATAVGGLPGPAFPTFAGGVRQLAPAFPAPAMGTGMIPVLNPLAPEIAIPHARRLAEQIAGPGAHPSTVSGFVENILAGPGRSPVNPEVDAAIRRMIQETKTVLQRSPTERIQWVREMESAAPLSNWSAFPPTSKRGGLLPPPCPGPLSVLRPFLLKLGEDAMKRKEEEETRGDLFERAKRWWLEHLRESRTNRLADVVATEFELPPPEEIARKLEEAIKTSARIRASEADIPALYHPSLSERERLALLERFHRGLARGGEIPMSQRGSVLGGITGGLVGGGLGYHFGEHEFLPALLSGLGGAAAGGGLGALFDRWRRRQSQELLQMEESERRRKLIQELRLAQARQREVSRGPVSALSDAAVMGLVAGPAAGAGAGALTLATHYGLEARKRKRAQELVGGRS